MPPAYAYTVRAGPMAAPHPFLITMDDASFHRPVLIRVTWRPSPAQAGLLVPDWVDGQPAVAMRDYDRAHTSRWFVRAAMYGFRDVELETVREGDRMTLGDIAPPKTRTRGRWFTWECGRWVQKPNHDFHQACYARARAEYWHTPPWEPGADMRPHPPTDETYAAQKAQP